MAATALMKFASEARLLWQCTSMPRSGHFMDTESRVLVHQTERYQLSLTHGDKGQFLELIFTPPLVFSLKNTLFK